MYLSNGIPTAHLRIDSVVAKHFQGTPVLSYVNVTVFIVGHICQGEGAEMFLASYSVEEKVRMGFSIK